MPPDTFCQGYGTNQTMKTLRLFALLDQLRSARHPVPAETLAQKLGVSLRTIYRDMASLQAMGAPVRGRSGLGYQLERGTSCRRCNLTPTRWKQSCSACVS
ncbi:helix-turn-helix domain-containing protein [Pannonibacter sp. Pt2-lr]